ncbi:FeoB-associated Cys-rich membrane protein [Brevibacillus laterosporus]|uniref:FeoB-associated Cys-rich membrane protein n=1 Tax=Brevibacillus laterosporus TaxID=1465 RepID=A0A502HEK8_BRELA|nr:FeoB-associated Cys-rich membrane protein [Brevibacillus laterosporus]QDX95721.1 FeoB-associated Cys-rich membrane protein [Brevibacillus laterosporus]TPG71648.1 FeoB-associated Cys-rich membrane protein [Brevibacillus laterosporus]TPG92352.1 FeoB-associated Cys-rich membrane protein [Brevibacillus laterosporus]
MVINFVIGTLIFGYAAWTLWRYVQKSKKGKCSGCSEEKKCLSACCLPDSSEQEHTSSIRKRDNSTS